MNFDHLKYILLLLAIITICTGCPSVDGPADPGPDPLPPDLPTNCNPDGDNSDTRIIDVWVRTDNGCVVSTQVRATNQDEADGCPQQIVGDYNVVDYEAQGCEFVFIVEVQDALSADPGDPPVISCDVAGTIPAMNSIDALSCLTSSGDYDNEIGITRILHDVSDQVRPPLGSSEGCIGTIDVQALITLVNGNCPP